MLLPLRLETRRIDDELCIRVFPDQPFVDTHQEPLTQDQYDTGMSFTDLQRVAAQGPNNADDLEKARGEWKELARRYSPPRAAWILQALLETQPPEVVESASEKIPRLFLLPERFIFLVYHGNQLAYAAAGNDVTGNLTLLPAPTTDDSRPDDGLFDADSKWISDFVAAETAGLAVKIPLVGPHRAAAVHFSEIVVVGLKAGGARADSVALEEFLRQHHYTGGFEFLPYGTPTNNTGQAPSGHSESEEQLLASYDVEVSSPLAATSTLRWRDTAAGQFARAVGLADGAASLSHIKGAELFPNDGSAETLRALWGATGDYAFNLVLGAQGTVTARAMLLKHTAEYLRPRGALAALRVGSLPYGVLPVTRIGQASPTDPSGWKALQNDHRADSYGPAWVTFDTGLHRALSALLPLWLERAQDAAVVPRAGTSGDPDEELLRILGMAPHSLTYRVRPVIDQTLVGFLMLLFQSAYFGPGSGFGGLADEVTAVGAWQQEWQLLRGATISLLEAMTGTTGVTNSPLLRAFAWGNGTELYMPLVRDPAATTKAGPEEYLPWLVENRTNALPHDSNTLLYDLTRRSLVADPWPQPLTSAFQLLTALTDYPIVAFFNNTVTAEKLAALAPEDLPTGTALVDLVNSLNDPTSRPYTDAAAIRSSKFGSATALFDQLATKLRRDFEGRLDAGLRDVIDGLSCRLDAWFSTLAAQRLDLMRDREPLGVHWGAYGYLEDVSLPPRTTMRGLPVTGGGFIHAPSIAQASAAAMLRSSFDAHRDDDDGNAYALNLTSRRVGRAQTLIDGVQQGQDIPALLGYQFERGLHQGRLDRLIDRFRKVFPLSAPDEGDTDAPAEVLAPRNVCDGRALVEAYAASSTGLAGLGIEVGDVDPDDQTTVRGLIEGLGDATDAVGDLLLFEGVFQAVQGNYERSGGALDACAGIGRPPDIESVATQLPGTNLRHRVCLLLPLSASPTPGARAAAEPRLNAWVESILGSREDIGCRVYANPGLVNATDDFDVRLDDLHLSGLDFVYMSNALPDGTGDTEIELRIRRFVTSSWSTAANATLRIAFDEPPTDAPGDARSVAHAMELGRWMLEMLGNATPLSIAALMHPDDVTPGALFAHEDVAALKGRADAAKGLLEAQVTKLASANVASMEEALDVCAGFGIQEAVLGATDVSVIAARAAAVVPIVEKRLGVAAPLLGSVSTTSGGDERIPALTAALKALFGESFVALPTFDLPAQAPVAAFDGTTLAALPSEDRVWLWLQQVAETHPRVRTLESLLMAAEAWGKLREAVAFPAPQVAQLPARTEYGWQALSDTELLGTAGRARGCQSIVALAPQSLTLSSVAGFVLDEWTETIPGSEITTGVSFEYNQPSQQAPQCFLLAVPGNFDHPTWGAEHLANIVRDTMNLARARLVDLDALPSVAGIFPALLFPITAKGKVKPVPGLIPADTLPAPEFADAL